MDWIHAINPWVDWNTYLLLLDCGGETVYILGTKSGCSHAYVEVFAFGNWL